MEAAIPQNQSKMSAILMVVVGSIMISFSSVFVKLADVGPITSGFYRVFFGTLFLLPFALFHRRSLALGWRSFCLAAACGLIFAVDLTVWHKSIHGVGPGLATVLANFQVFVLTGFGVLVFKEKISKWSYVSILIAISGLAVLVGPGWDRVTPDWKLGVGFGLMTAFVYAAYIILLRHLQTGEGGYTQVWNMAMVSLWTALFMAVEIPLTGETFSIPDVKSIWALAAYGLLGQSVGWYLISRGIPLLNVSVSGIIILLQPSLAFTWDILFFSRPTTFLDFMGAGMVLAAIYLGAIAKKSE